MPMTGQGSFVLRATPAATIRIPAQRDRLQVTPQTQATAITRTQSEGRQTLKRSVQRTLDISTEVQKPQKKKPQKKKT